MARWRSRAVLQYESKFLATSKGSPLTPALAMDSGEGSKQSRPTDASRGSLPVRLVLQRGIGVRRKLLVSIPFQSSLPSGDSELGGRVRETPPVI